MVHDITMEVSEEDLILLGINSQLSLTWRRYNLILDSYGSIQEAIEDSFKDIKDKGFAAISETKTQDLLEQGILTVEQMREESINFVINSHHSFPRRLRDIADQPSILFYRGNIELTNNEYCLGAVGSRAITPQSKSIIDKTFQELQGYPITVVSGLAMGVDDYVHQVSLDKGLPCIGVLGTSLLGNEYYPRQTKHTADRIIDSGGLIISEYSKSAVGNKYNFVRRNRIIAGLSDCVGVWQAARGSGSCLTAQLALDQGKTVLALGGWPYEDAYLGTQDLIRKGAVSIFGAHDILRVLGLVNDDATAIKELSVEDNDSTASQTLQLPSQASDRTKYIFSKISLNPISVDELAITCGLDPKVISMELTLLEIYSRARTTGANLWIIN
jgi:DNA processing protein